jgi:ribosomal protein S18 acetylase RimI-like enzyme
LNCENSKIIIKPARTIKEIEDIKILFREYELYLNVDLCFQGFDEEISALPGKYLPPGGELLTAVDAKKVLGCVGLRKLDKGVCEMKRLFVRPEARGIGLGKKLALNIIAKARELGYFSMKLDTLDSLKKAVSLYESLGFKRIEPYYKNPLPGALYWELKL